MKWGAQMDLRKLPPDNFQGILHQSAICTGLRVQVPAAKGAHMRTFHAILREVRKLKDWLVEQKSNYQMLWIGKARSGGLPRLILS